MIRLFVSDIDGCLAQPYAPFRLDRLAELVRKSAAPDVPPLSLCSGRAYPYVEAMAQLLNLRVPVLFEAGAGMFDPQTASVRWHPGLTSDVQESIGQIRAFMETVVRDTGMSIDFAKRSQAALVGTDSDELTRALEHITHFVADEFPAYHTFHTHISIDVVPESLTKVAGLQWLGEVLDVELSEIAFIGDTNGDIGALTVAGRSFAPRNATEAVKQAVQSVCEGADINGVIEAYERIIEENRRTS